MWRQVRFQIMFIAIATALAGEIKVEPFGWEFRFGLGSSIFLFLLLIMRQVPYVKTGMITGIFVVIFRTLISAIFWQEPSSIFQVLINHLPAMFYYIAFAFGMSKIKEKLLTANLFLLGAIIVLIDISSNIVELSVSYLLLDISFMTSINWLIAVVVAIVRVYFIIGVYANIHLVQLKALHKEQEKRLDQMLKFGSNLYSESFYLKKMMNTIERITSQSYQLYRKLQEKDLHEYGNESLNIAEQIHEVKKDAQRIMSGLNNLYDSKTFTEMEITDILIYIVRGNENYSEWLRKDIQFVTEIDTQFKTSHYFLIITVLNNLITNAVEAIEEKGKIVIRITEKEEYIYISVIDNGKGIDEKDLPLIFEAGFTTKYNEKGIAATGIGLVHVKNIISIFNGEIFTEVEDGQTNITIKLPSSEIIKKE